MNLQLVSTTDVQRGFGKILDNLTEPLMVMRDNRPKAVIITTQDYRQFESDRKQLATYRLLSLLDKIHRRNKHIPIKQVEKDIEEALEHVRGRRHRH